MNTPWAWTGIESDHGRCWRKLLSHKSDCRMPAENVLKLKKSHATIAINKRSTDQAKYQNKLIVTFINGLICKYSLLNISWRFHYRSSWFEICLFRIWEASSWSYITPHCLPKEAFWAYTHLSPGSCVARSTTLLPLSRSQLSCLAALFADVILVERKSEQSYYSIAF